MKISLNWLKDYVDFNISAQEIADILSDLGLPTEDIVELDGDTMIDVEVTSNRGDCLSHIGIAREIAVATGAELKLPKVELEYSGKNVTEFVDVTITEPELCNRYTARFIEGVKVGPTPDWMKQRLEAVGVRSVNNVVDATNYAMLECGQPPHAFDYDKLNGDKVIVRKAISGERIVTIDSSKCDLGVDMLVIADEQEPIAVAGVMGGLMTEVSEGTTNILLEEAHFAPVSVRTTGRSIGISSDAMFRFERHVDVEMIEWASQRCAQLIQMVAGGKIAKGVADDYPVKHESEKVSMRLERLNKLIGIEYDPKEVEKVLDSLGFAPDFNKKTAVFECSCPTWRHDISREVDVIEEVVRVIGYDRIPVERKINIEVAAVDKRYSVIQKIGRYLNACGFYETLNITFTDDDTAKLFTTEEIENHLGVKDVTRKSANLLRQTLIGSLLGNMKSNHNVGNKDCRFFEIADTFAKQDGELDEKTKVALACDGDIRLLRGVLEGLVNSLNKASVVKFVPAEICWASAGAEVFIDDKKVGAVGVVSDKVAKEMDFKETKPVAMEIEFDVLKQIDGAEFKIKHLPKFPAISRDLSIIINEEVTWQDIENSVKSVSPKEMEAINYVDVYRGKPIPGGKKSLTLTMCFRDDDGTLKHDIVDGFETEILDKLKKDFKAELRTA